MATWEDGPEYAPLERPADFVVPSAAPLDVVPPVTHPAAGSPRDRPAFADPTVPVAPLATLIPVPADPRDPRLPFDVASATMTSDSAWGALQTQPSGLERTGARVPEPWGPPSEAPWAGPSVPAGPPPLPSPPTDTPAPADPRSFPAPGTPGWFGPGPYAPPPAPAPVTFAQVLQAATPGLCICLVIGGMIFVLAPVIIAVGLGLASRVTVARAEVRQAFGFAIGLVALIAAVGALTNDTGFSDWWGLVGVWSLVICWVLIGVVLGLVYRGLKTGAAPPRRSTWG